MNMCAPMHIFVIALMVQSGLAIKCFNCDSESNPVCADMKDINIESEECTFEKQEEIERGYNNPDRLWLQRISDIHYHKTTNELDAQMVCQKLVGTDENEKITVVRRCQLANINPCNFTMKHLSKNKQIDCSICEKDDCNGSSNVHIFSSVIGTVAAATILKNLIL